MLSQRVLDSAYTVAPCRSGQLLVGLSRRLCLVDVNNWGRQELPGGAARIVKYSGAGRMQSGVLLAPA